jgi:hypothetical protein
VGIFDHRVGYPHLLRLLFAASRTPNLCAVFEMHYSGTSWNKNWTTSMRRRPAS